MHTPLFVTWDVEFDPPIRATLPSLERGIIFSHAGASQPVCRCLKTLDIE